MRRTRGHGEGSISKRKDGRWEARVSQGWRHGKRSYQSYYGATRSEVQEKLNEHLHKYRRGQPIPDQQSVEQFLRLWLEEEVSKKKPGTYERYETLIRRELIPQLGCQLLHRLRAVHIQPVLNAMPASKARYVRTVLRAALNQAKRWGLIDENAAALTEPPSKRGKGRVVNMHTIPNPQEAQRLLQAAKGDPNEALYVLALTTGLRRGELIGLRRGDVDLDGRKIEVRQQIVRVRVPGSGQASALMAVEPKSESSSRTISPLPMIAVEALRAHYARQAARQLQAGKKWVQSDLVFTTATGRPLSTVQHHFERLLVKAGLSGRGFRFHDLRHACASFLLSRGVPPKVIQELLGHANIAVTMNVYAHVMPVLRQQAADAMDATFSA